jgi:2-aminoadipate transaminase
MANRESLSRRAAQLHSETLVSALMARALGQPNLVSLAVGFVDHETLPVEATRRAMERIWADAPLARAALQYGTTPGHRPLCEALLDRMLAADRRSAAEMNLSIDDLVLMPGSNQLLFLLGDILLDPGDIVICAAPTYYVYLGALMNLGARAIGVESDAEGVIPEAIETQLARLHAAGELDRVKAIYLTSYYDNPRAVTIPAGRRARLVEIAKRWSRRHSPRRYSERSEESSALRNSGKILRCAQNDTCCAQNDTCGRQIYLIEDAAYRELRYQGDDLPSMRSFDAEGDTVIYAGTFSKSYSPGIRVGWAVLPAALRAPVLAEKGNIDFGSPHFNQVLMAEVLRSGLFDQHVRELRVQYRAKTDAILAAAEEYLRPIGGVDWVRPGGGLYLWVTLPEGIDAGMEGPLFDRAVAEGVLYVPGQYCYPPEGQPAARNTLRLSFGVASPDRLRHGVAALARAIRQVG